MLESEKLTVDMNGADLTTEQLVEIIRADVRDSFLIEERTVGAGEEADPDQASEEACLNLRRRKDGRETHGAERRAPDNRLRGNGAAEGFHLTYGKQVMCGEANAVNTVDHFSYAIASRAGQVGVCKSCAAAFVADAVNRHHPPVVGTYRRRKYDRMPKYKWGVESSSEEQPRYAHGRDEVPEGVECGRIEYCSQRSTVMSFLNKHPTDDSKNRPGYVARP